MMRSVHRGTVRRLYATAAVCILGLGTLDAAQAQDAVADFYRGKQMKFVIRSEPGRRLRSVFATDRHATSSITFPAVRPSSRRTCPAAGGLQAANFVGDLAPRDGTVLTMVSQALPMDQSLGFTPQLKADLGEFGWIW